ncbi:MAG: NAD(P)H-dependent oxidoreductase subunit E, partial [Planctomycetota bacterium]|nr:NAD(P)H-dependent oxidoreductase subunit E [Planctomycetota bacterium]
MSRDDAASVPDRLREAGGLLEGVARDIARETGVPEAHVWGIGSFYHMLSRSEAKVRVCTGLSCLLGGAQDVLDAAKAQGLPVEEASCLAGCDVPPAVLRDRRTMPHVTVADVKAAGDDWSKLDSAAAPGETEWTGAVGPAGAADGALAIDLSKLAAPLGAAFRAAAELGPEGVID